MLAKLRFYFKIDNFFRLFLQYGMLNCSKKQEKTTFLVKSSFDWNTYSKLKKSPY